MNSHRPPWTTLLIIALLAILGCCLRSSIAASECLWLDELHTSWSVNGSIDEVASRAADGNQSPLFFWMTWVFVSVFGHFEFSLRSISIIGGIGTLLAASRFVWRWTGSAIAATLVAWIISIDVQFIYYGSEARPYALLQLLSVIQVSLFFEALWGRKSITAADLGRVPVRRFWPHWSLAISSILLINTHLTSGWLILTEAIFMGIVWLSESLGGTVSEEPELDRDGALSRWISTAILVATGSLPMLLQLTTIFERRGNWQNISSILGLWKESWPIAVSLMILPMIFLLFSRILSRRVGRANSTKNEVLRIAFVFLWAIVPVGCVVGLDYFRVAPMALQRYTLVGAAGFPIFAGLCLGCLATKPGKLILAGLIVAATVIQNPIFESVVREGNVPQLRFEDWKTPINMINAKDLESRHPVFLFSNLIEDRDALQNPETRFQSYLLFPVSGLYQLDGEDREISAGPTLAFTHFNDKQIKSISQQGGAWAIIRAEGELVHEIGDEVRTRTATIVGKHPSEIEISVFETPNSPVYWMSVQW